MAHRSHIVAAAEIVKEVNRRLNMPTVDDLSNRVHKELDAIIAKHVSEAMVSLGFDDVDTAVAIRNAVTIAFYIKLEDLLVSLAKESITLTKET